jgi:hypothetical protein
MSDQYERPHKIVAKEGSYETLKFLDIHGKTPQKQLLSYMERDGFFLDDIKERIVELERIGFIVRCPWKVGYGPAYRLTAEGKEAVTLVDIINGDPLSSILDRMTSLRTSTFTLVTHDLTNYFIDDLAYHRDFSEVFICSPWIRLFSNALRDIGHILESAQRITKSSPKLHLITRPISETPPDLAEKSWNSQIRRTLCWFKKRDADIVCVPNLHTKLFIIFGKGFQTGIFGSENLTGAKNIELGIRITDSVIVNKLYIYWEDIYNSPNSAEFEEENLVGK